jgi:hypothetical protein
MKRIFVLAAVLFSAALLQAQDTKTTPTPAPAPAQVKDIAKMIKFSEVDHDFGKTAFGKPIEYELTVTNISNEEVKLENIQVGCGCTTPKYEQGKVLKAGETTKITLGFNGSTKGVYAKVVTIFFSGGLQQVIKFHGETYEVPETPVPANDNGGKMKQKD